MESPPVNKWLVTVSVTFGTLMGTIDASIVNVAIPHLQAGLGATVEEIAWVSTGFIMATVVVMPLTAFLGRFFGQKRVYMASLALFVVGSTLCGMARSLTTLVAFRVLQGFGAGALQPTEQAILRQTFPPREQGMAMALFAMAVMVGPALGPTLGGYIVDHYTWPWIFYINLPVGALGLFMVSRFVFEPADIRAANAAQAARQRRNLDWIGIVVLAVGLASLQFVLEEGNRKEWFDSPLIVGAGLLSAIMLALFCIRELTAPAPAVSLSLFRNGVFLSGTLIGAVMFAMLFSITFLLPLFMQNLLGYTAVDAGITLMPRTLVMMVLTPLVGRIYNHVSPRLLVGVGVIVFSLGSYLMGHFTLQTSERGIVHVLVLHGVAFSCLFVPLTTVALSTVERFQLTDATGLNSLFRQVGGSIGLAVFATLLTRYGVRAGAELAPDLVPGRVETRQRLAMLRALLIRRGLDPGRAEQAARAALAGTVQRQALVLAFERIYQLAGIIFLAVLPLLLLLKVDRRTRRAPVPVEA